MILMRHGQSHFNVHFGRNRQDPGLRDPGLTDTGRAQASSAADHLRDKPVTEIIASPYTRALETAEIVAAALDMTLSVEPLVGEQAVFTCDIGTRRSDLTDRWPHLSLGHLEDEWWPPLEESERSLERRCRTFRTRMSQRTPWDGILVVTHYHVIRSLTGHPVQNATLVRFDPSAPHPGGGTVVRLPDTC